MQYGSEYGNDVRQSMKYLCFCGDYYSEIKLFLCGFGSFSPLGLVQQLMFESGPLLIPRSGFQRVIGGDWFRIAEAIEWSKRAGLESKPALIACSKLG
jgi:hypothetical protein